MQALKCKVFQPTKVYKNIICQYFLGWRHLVYIDTEEYQITDERVTLATIANLGNQWKIIHEFKPTEYQQVDPLLGRCPLMDPLSILVHGQDKSVTKAYSICFPPATMVFKHMGISMATELPKVGNWTRIEITQENGADGRLYLSLSVGRNLIGREWIEHASDYTEVKIYAGDQFPQPGSIRRLVVLQKS